MKIENMEVGREMSNGCNVADEKYNWKQLWIAK